MQGMHNTDTPPTCCNPSQNSHYRLVQCEVLSNGLATASAAHNLGDSDKRLAGTSPWLKAYTRANQRHNI